MAAVRQVVSRKNEAAAAEGVRQNDLRSGVDVAPRNLCHALGILQVPALRRGPGSSPSFWNSVPQAPSAKTQLEAVTSSAGLAMSFAIYVKHSRDLSKWS